MKERLAFDKRSKRAIDANGFLHVELSPISKEAVNDYYGYEIPGWQEAGLERDRVYKGYRPGEELKKAAATFNGLNILSEHIKDGAAESPKDYIVGSLGTDAAYQAPYLVNSLIIKDAEAIELLNPADPDKTPKKEISASYRYTPIFEGGTFRNERYDFVMVNIAGNHVALVEEGRAGPDVVVSDSKPQVKGRKMTNPIELLTQLIASLKEMAGGSAAGDEDVSAAGTTDLPADSEEVDVAVKPAEEIAQDNDNPPETAQGGAASAEDPAGKKTAEDEDPGEEKKEERPAMDKKIKKSSNPAQAVTVAMDAAAIARKVEARINAKIQAARECRAILGEVDPLAFDSAAGIYAKALEVAGNPTKVTDPTALREMVKLAAAGKPKDHVYPAIAAALANDSKAEADPNFKGLANIRRAIH